MRKVIVVAFREYQAAVRTKSFIISLIMMPVMMGGSLVVQLTMKDKTDINPKKIALVDYTSQLGAAILTDAAERNDKEIFTGEGETRRQTKPRFNFEAIDPGETPRDELELALSERVRSNDLFAFVIIPPDLINPAENAWPGIDYYSNSPTYDDVLDWLREPVRRRVQELRCQLLDISPEAARRVTAWAPLHNLGLVSRTKEGTISKAERTNIIASTLIPMGMMMLMFMIIMVGASPLVQSVLEEKTNRIMEVLLGSVTPFQLMLGKLLGMVGVSLTVLTFYLIGGFIAANQAGYGAMFPSHLVIWFAVYQALAVLLFGSIFIAIGAAVSDLREAQSMMTPTMLIVVAPMFIWLNVVREPNSSFSLIASLIPPCTPMLMILRQTVPPGVPLWQPILGISLVVVTTVFCVWAAGRIFRVGVLMQGRGAKFGEMLRWVFTG